VPQISDLVRRAVARRQSRLRGRRGKEDFLANVSHELRTPLSAIIGYSAILSDELHTVATQDQKSALSRIQANSVELLELIEGVLLLNAIEAGEVDLNIHPFDLGQTVRRAVDRFQTLAQAKGLSIQTDLQSSVLSTIGDEEKVERILWALLDNAIKFTARGRLTVTVGPAAHAGAIEIEVSDTGIGMDPESLRHVLEGLSQADPSARRRYRGLGLGMRLATRLVQLLGGEIDIHSEIDRGTRVVVIIPTRPGTFTAALH